METFKPSLGKHNVLGGTDGLNTRKSDSPDNYTYLYDDIGELSMYTDLDVPSFYHKQSEMPVAEKAIGKNTSCSRQLICMRVMGLLIFLLLTLVVVMGYFFFNGFGDCQTFPYIENGNIINSTGYKHGDFLEISCDEGSELVGSSIITCYSSGKWSSIPKCLLKSCSAPVVPNGMILEFTPDAFVVGTEIVVSCTEGYDLYGLNPMVCKFDETWSDDPSCKARDCGTPRNIENGKIIDHMKTTYNNTFSVECNEGHTLQGRKSVKCTKAGVWEELPTCVKTICGLPTIPEHGSLSNITGTEFLATASFKCDEGFKLTGQVMMRCQADGHWSKSPSCIKSR